TCALPIFRVDDDLLHDGHAQSLGGAALDLADDGQRVEGLADVLRAGQFDHLDEAEFGVDLDHGPVRGEGVLDVAVALAGAQVEGFRRPVPPLLLDLDGVVAEHVGEVGEDFAAVGDDLAALQQEFGGRPGRVGGAEAAPAELQDPLADQFAGVLDGAAGDVRLPRGGGRAGGAHPGVGGVDGHLVDAQLGAGDLRVDGDAALADLGHRGVHGRDRSAADGLHADPRPGVVVEALGEAHVPDADRVADAAHHALAVRDVGQAARQLAHVGALAGLPLPLGRHRHGLDAAQQFGDRRRGVDPLAGGQERALLHGVELPQLHRV